MSRTIKGRKGIGFNYTRKRMGNESQCADPGFYAKQDAKSKERSRDKQLDHDAIRGCE